MKKPPPKPRKAPPKPREKLTPRENFWQKLPETNRYNALMRALMDSAIPGGGLFSGGMGSINDPIKYVRNWEA